MIFLYAFLILAAIAAPLALIYRRVCRGKKSKAPLLADLCSFFGILVVGTVLCFSQGSYAAESAQVVSAGGALVANDSFAQAIGFLSAALSVGIASIAGAIAVSASASAALGAISENENLFGKSLIYVGLAEGLALYGLLIAFMILSKL